MQHSAQDVGPVIPRVGRLGQGCKGGSYWDDLGSPLGKFSTRPMHSHALVEQIGNIEAADTLRAFIGVPAAAQLRT
eukprot:CAMPEP_0203904654 /NCGR_PEP_ID=MMETSP0359-20131031/46453_1 /ASSEMBLY_ACC=CAM_ASM_000338 /TAXON_ID=268821 /ORGANISM="Scrippsiella Hangoei, Strain SHTV-5" /LENGTH=75 /DNA_ID=CAMNT_0050828941 /DNA_START=25 /DNA_END=248 /DNA_ORIENTATION=+